MSSPPPSFEAPKPPEESRFLFSIPTDRGVAIAVKKRIYI
jgi:hypothetical protein